VIAGYDRMITSNVLAGVFADYDHSDSEFKVSTKIGGNDVYAEFLSLDKSWTIGARAGLVMPNDVLVYGLAAYTRVQLNDVTFTGGGNSATIIFPELDGITVGGGFEKMITDYFSLRAEYRYTRLEDASVPFIPGLVDMNFDSSMHSAKLMATFRFSGPVDAP
jgi:outer membrane immunogenic protein